jgi:hypothetical protein
MGEPGRRDHAQVTQRPTQFPTQSHHRELQAHKARAIMCLFHEKQILRLLQAYVVNFNQARPHQGIQRVLACLFSSFLTGSPFHEGKIGDESDCIGATLRSCEQMSQLASTAKRAWMSPYLPRIWEFQRKDHQQVLPSPQVLYRH